MGVQNLFVSLPKVLGQHGCIMWMVFSKDIVSTSAADPEHFKIRTWLIYLYLLAYGMHGM
jgi:hypothetical protein